MTRRGTEGSEKPGFRVSGFRKDKEVAHNTFHPEPRTLKPFSSPDPSGGFAPVARLLCDLAPSPFRDGPLTLDGCRQ